MAPDAAAINGNSHNDYAKQHQQQQQQQQQGVIDIATNLLTQRFSCRYFDTDRVPSKEIIYSILDAARHAPSGSNFQPWKVHILQGETKRKLGDIISEASQTEAERHHAPYVFYPSNEFLSQPDYSDLNVRRKAFGKHFYGPLHISREDKDARRAVTARNWTFFDAPIGLLITTINVAPKGSYLDVGFFVMSIVIALRAHGLECCVQEAHATFHDIYSNILNFTPIESVVCGIAIGYPDTTKVDKLTGHQDKMSIEELAVFHH